MEKIDRRKEANSTDDFGVMTEKGKDLTKTYDKGSYTNKNPKSNVTTH